MRHIDILLFNKINLLDVAGPAQAFSSAEQDHTPLYKTRFVSIDGKPVASCCGLQLVPDAIASAESESLDLIVPGGLGVDALLDAAHSEHLTDLLIQWNKDKQRRTISICSGALLLANAGILDNRRATTHWSRMTQVINQFPLVNWQIDNLYIKDDNLYTSAGVTSGIDLSLSIIEQDHGGKVALEVAREMVVYKQRPGGQSQFSDIISQQMQAGDVLSSLVNEIIQYPARLWTVEQMAQSCHFTPRTLTRHFHKTLSTTPKRFVEKIRVGVACELITSGVSPSTVQTRSGLHSPQQMQRAFKRQLGTSVNDYTRRFTTQQHLEKNM